MSDPKPNDPTPVKPPEVHHEHAPEEAKRQVSPFFKAVQAGGLLLIVGLVLLIFLGYVLNIPIPGMHHKEKEKPVKAEEPSGVHLVKGEVHTVEVPEKASRVLLRRPHAAGRRRQPGALRALSMEAYSDELRQRVLVAVDSKLHSVSEAAALFGVSPSWVRRLVQRRRETGSIAPRKRRRGPGRKLDEAQRQRLVELVAQFPNATLPELRDRLGADVATSTVWRALHDLGLTLKQLRQRRSL